MTDRSIGAMWTVASPYVAIFVVQFLFASNSIVSKIGLDGENFPPLLFASMRSLFAFPCLFLAAVASNNYSIPTIPRKDFLIFLGLGMAGIFGNQVGNIYGLSLTGPTVTSIMMPSTAVWTMAISIGLKREKPSKLKFLGVVFAIVGSTIVILFPSKSSSGAETSTGMFVLGMFCLMINTLSYAIYLVMQKPMLKYYHPNTIGMYTFLFGGSLVFLSSFYYYVTTDFSKFSGRTWFAVFFASILASGVSYFLTLWAMKRSNPSISALFSTLQPLLVTIMVYFWRGDVITIPQTCGGICILAGLFVSIYSQRQVDKKDTVVDANTVQLETLGDEESNDNTSSNPNTAILDDQA